MDYTTLLALDPSKPFLIVRTTPTGGVQVWGKRVAYPYWAWDADPARAVRWQKRETAVANLARHKGQFVVDVREPWEEQVKPNG